MNPDFIFNLTPNSMVSFDIESFPNIFTFTARCNGRKWVFEISDRKNDTQRLCMFIVVCKSLGVEWVGYNNIGYDYPVVHHIYQNRKAGLTAVEIYNKSMSIINAGEHARFSNTIWEDDWAVPQIDLYKLHHFDNMARATSLKVLEFNMRMMNIEEAPFPFGIFLTPEQMDLLLDYNDHDVIATEMFLEKSSKQIELRRKLGEKYGRNFINHNSTKIGKDILITALEAASKGCCYDYSTGRKRMVQTKRDKIVVADIIFPYVQFNHPEFNRVLNWFKAQVLTETKGSIKDVNCSVNGFQFDFGTGGIHGSVESQIVTAGNGFKIIDIDVKSYYPTLSIRNNVYPAHLSSVWCEVYGGIFDTRQNDYPKKTHPIENEALKLALNGAYGDTNSEYSPLYDPQYTMTITINGQLLICMLAEALMAAGELTVIQVNTDGITIKIPDHLEQWVMSVCKWWEGVTKLELEYANYSRMFIRDVNNYIAEYTNGDLKRKGAYEYDIDWHQNHSALVVPKAAEAALVHGKNIRDFITTHQDIFDFFLRAKVPRSSHLEYCGEKVGNIARYYISANGDPLFKVMPTKGIAGEYKRANSIPDHIYNAIKAEVGSAWDARIHTKNKKVYEAESRSCINTGWCVTLCNNLNDKRLDEVKCWVHSGLNLEWYIKETEKLVYLLKGESDGREGE